MAKLCSCCQEIKDEHDFYFRDGRPISQCKLCVKQKVATYKSSHTDYYSQYGKDYYRTNQEYLKAKAKKYKQSNKEICAQRDKRYREEHKVLIQQIQKRYRMENRAVLREKKRIYMKERYLNDLNFKLKQRIRTRIYHALKSSSRCSRTEALLGCTISFFRKYIEGLFCDGMTWDNYGEWQLDHIRPCASFDLTDHEQQRICFYYMNQQPLWKHDNLAKSDKWENANG